VAVLVIFFALIHLGEIGAIAGLALARTHTAEQLEQVRGLITGLAAAQVGYEKHQSETRDLLTRINEQVQALATEARMREIVRQEVGRGVRAIGSVVSGGGAAAVSGDVQDAHQIIPRPTRTPKE
jgi:hypothetical protein